MFEGDTQRAWHLRQLRASLLRLASASAGQPALFPDYAITPNELALDFDHWASVVISRYGRDLRPEEHDSLAAIHQQFEMMSRDGRQFEADVWSEAALRSSEQWRDVRRLAAGALELFGRLTGEI